MSPEELIDLVSKTVHQKAETQTLELKAAHVNCPKRLYDTLSSFSNQDRGGILLFGVDDANLPMTDYEPYSYEAFRKHLYDDERPVGRASLKVLNPDVL